MTALIAALLSDPAKLEAGSGIEKMRYGA